MRQRCGQPRRLEGLLHPEHQIALNGPNVWRHVKAGARHQEPVNLVKRIFGVVDGEDDEDVHPIPTKEIDERGKRQLCPRWFEHRKQDDAKSQGADHPSQIDALHRGLTPSCGHTIPS